MLSPFLLRDVTYVGRLTYVHSGTLCAFINSSTSAGVNDKMLVA